MSLAKNFFGFLLRSVNYWRAIKWNNMLCRNGIEGGERVRGGVRGMRKGDEMEMGGGKRHVGGVR